MLRTDDPFHPPHPRHSIRYTRLHPLRSFTPVTAVTFRAAGVRIFDVQPARQLLARVAPNQQLMNDAYALDNPRYLPFRLQLVLKFICLGLIFSSAVPILYFLIALFMGLSWYIDKWNLLRVWKPLPVTSPRMIRVAVHVILPLSVAAHSAMTLVFYSNYRIDLTTRGPSEGGASESD